MKIVVVGAGNVGYYLCQIFSDKGHHVTVVESNATVATDVDDNINVKVVQGNGVSASILMRANVEKADYFLALTSDDRTNLLSCSLARALGAQTIIARIHDHTYSDNSYVNYQRHFGIDFLLNPEALCAVELTKRIRNPGRVAVENFARGQIEVQLVTIGKRCKYAGKQLKDIALDKRVKLAYVQRGDHYDVPTGETIIEEGDSVTLVGPPDVLFEVRPLFETEKSLANSKGVTLFGGSETSIAMIRLLSHPRFKIRLIESDPQLCRDLAERFPEVTIIHGTATSLRLMEEEHVGDSDYFIACTKKDEDNIMTCVQAAKLGASHVQLVINKPDYENVLDHMRLALGVDAAVAPRIVTVNEVLRLTSQESFIELANLPGDTVKVIEIRAQHNSSATEKSIREVAWPPSSLILAVLHKFEAMVPSPDDIILPGDRVVAIVSMHQINDLLKLFN